MTLHLQHGAVVRVGRRQRLAASTALAGHLRLSGLAGSLALALAPAAHALPTGGSVAAGAASLASTVGKLVVTQTSQNAVLNFQSFGIGTGEAVQFVQPNSTAVALNRVLGADPSAILGSLSANGKVFLVNPNGILFAKGAQVNVGGLVASTLDITDTNFMAGAYKFSGASTKAVLNLGSINAARGGYVALLGANVSNQGSIVANLGSVVLAGGSALTLDVAADGLLNVAVDQAAVEALAQNGGLIRADGGQVLMTAQTAGMLLRTVVNNTGVIEARSIGQSNGKITLVGDASNGQVDIAGTLDASGAGAGQTGGGIRVTGHEVDLLASAKLTTSGDRGGGSVLVGGGYRGEDATIANAATVTLAKGAVISVDAITSGNGGQAVLWSEGETRALGAISARGGALSGDGGRVETSGHRVTVGESATVNTLAAKGKSGLWLLDPIDYTIATVGGDETPTQVTLSLAASNRVITASNDIRVSDDITWVTPQTLELNAGHDVLVNAAITASTMNSGITLVAGHDVRIGGALTASGSGSHIDVAANQDIDVNQAVTASGGGAILFVADADGTGGTAGGTVNLNPLFDVTSMSKTLYYSPPGGYVAPTTYTGFDAYMWVFVAARDKVYDGGTTAVGTFRGDPTVMGVKDVALTGGTIAFADSNVGQNKAVNYSGYSLTGGQAGLYALYPGVAALTGANTAQAVADAVATVGGTTTAAITPAPLTIRANDATKVYGQSLTLPGTAFTSAGLVNNELIGSVTETSLGAAPTAIVAGSPYAIIPSAAVGGTFSLSNYAVTYQPGVLAVTPAPLTVTADNATKNYGQAFAFTGAEFGATGLVNGDMIDGVTLVSAGQPATASVGGSAYPIVPSRAFGNTFAPNNYVINYVSGSLVVTPAALVITANSASKPYGDALIFDGTAFTAAGLQNSETVGTVTETSSGAAAAAASGPYVIAVSDAVGGTFTPGNYRTTYAAGALAVLPAVVAPPVVAPPVVTPPGVTAPVVSDPVVAPPVITPVVTPPEVTPPVVVTPVVLPPEVTPPVVSPPEVTPPVITTAIVTTPVVTGPVVTAAVVATSVETAPVGTTELLAPRVLTSLNAASSGVTPAGLSALAGPSANIVAAQGAALVGAPLGMRLAVIGQGVRMPLYPVAETQPVQATASAPQTAQLNRVDRPIISAPKAAYVAPVYPRKQDRN